ncbi:15864_t:CDS:2, partial [Funneliformis mosseae]
MVLSFGQTQNGDEAMPTKDQEALVISQDVTKIPEVMDMLTSEQDEQDLSQSYEASSESIRSTSCVLSKQLQVNASKLTCNLENCEDSSRSESCDMEELKSDLHDEVIAKLDKNIIVEQELKQQLSSPAHTSTSDQTLEEQDPSSDTAQNIVCMFRKTNKLGQEAILYWCYFIEKYDKRIDNLVVGGVKKKTATSMVYQEIKQLLPDITGVNLRQKILRARKLYKLFNTLGIEKIKQVSYSADAISSLSYPQIQNIIDHVSSVISSHNETVKILHNQSHVTSKINPTNTYIPPKAKERLFSLYTMASEPSSTTITNATEVFQLEALSLNYLRNQDISTVSYEKDLLKLNPCSLCNKGILTFRLQAFTVLSCGHIFHRICLGEYIAQGETTNPLCPLCPFTIELFREEAVLASGKYHFQMKQTDTGQGDEELMDSLGLVEDDPRAGQGSQSKQVTMQDQVTSPIMIEDDASENNDNERIPDASNRSANVQTNDDTQNLSSQQLSRGSFPRNTRSQDRFQELLRELSTPVRGEPVEANDEEETGEDSVPKSCEDRVKAIRESDSRLNGQQAMTQVYNEVKAHLPDITMANL